MSSLAKNSAHRNCKWVSSIEQQWKLSHFEELPSLKDIGWRSGNLETTISLARKIQWTNWLGHCLQLWSNSILANLCRIDKLFIAQIWGLLVIGKPKNTNPILADLSSSPLDCDVARKLCNGSLSFLGWWVRRWWWNS